MERQHSLAKLPCTEFAFNILCSPPWHSEISCSHLIAKNKRLYCSGAIKPMLRFEITNWLHVGYIYPRMFSLAFRVLKYWLLTFKNRDILHKLGFLLGEEKNTEYLRALDPHSWGQQSARSEQLLPSITAWTLQFATFLIIPHCLPTRPVLLICFTFLAPVDLSANPT